MKGIFHWLSMNLPVYAETGSENEECGSQDDDDSNKPVDSGPYLRIIKDQSQATDKSTGFDLYGTARFYEE